jgi:hypothetical protein
VLEVRGPWLSIVVEVHQRCGDCGRNLITKITDEELGSIKNFYFTPVVFNHE